MRDTSRVGEIAVAQVLAALVNQGKFVLTPFGDSRRYDLGIDEEDGRFVRVQCKNGKLIKGAVMFYACSVDSRSQKGRCIRKGYRGQVEAFGVYCPDNGEVYFVPVEDVPTTGCCLRVDPPRNHQKKGIRWAKDYRIDSASPSGNNSDLSSPDLFDII
jgi:hypothetical protein